VKGVSEALGKEAQPSAKVGGDSRPMETEFERPTAAAR
jgi:hypothetical protein